MTTVRTIVLLLIGVLAALLGMSPWLLGDPHLPALTITSIGAPAADAPFGFLPFLRYPPIGIAALVLTGSIVAGLLGRVAAAASAPTRIRTRDLLALLIGVVGLQAIAVAQSSTVVAGGLSEGMPALGTLDAATGLVIGAIVVGVALFTTIARAAPAGALVGAAVAAVPLGWWAVLIAAPPDDVTTEDQLATVALLRFVPAVIVGVAIAATGLGTVPRRISAVIALAILAVSPAVSTALEGAANGWILDRTGSASLDGGLAPFSAALRSSAAGIPSVVGLAIGIALLGRILRSARRTRSTSGIGEDASTSDSEPASAVGSAD